MTIPDHVEAGEVQMSQNEFRTKYGIDASKQVKLVKVVFMRYQHPDLQEIKIFMKGKSQTAPRDDNCAQGLEPDADKAQIQTLVSKRSKRPPPTSGFVAMASISTSITSKRDQKSSLEALLKLRATKNWKS